MNMDVKMPQGVDLDATSNKLNQGNARPNRNMIRQRIKKAK
jgi:hypothetical protein